MKIEEVGYRGEEGRGGGVRGISLAQGHSWGLLVRITSGACIKSKVLTV